MTDLPEPLTPADCDLRDFAFMPLDIIRLFGSEFHALSTDSEWRAGVTLWLKSFHQVPAASLPDDDIQLARLAELGRDVKGWKAMRIGALRGWVKCADGRLYHPVVAEKAMEAWSRKLIQRERSKRGNDARWGKRGHPANESQEVEGVRKDAKRMAEHHPQGIPEGLPQGVPEGVPQGILQGSQGTGTGIGTETGIENTHRERAGAPLPDAAVRVVKTEPDRAPTPAGAICRAMKAAGVADPNPGHPDLLMLLEAGATEAEFVGAARSAAAKRKGFAYAIGTLKRQRAEAAEGAKGLHRGPMPAGTTLNPQEALEAANRAVAQRFLAEREAARATQ